MRRSALARLCRGVLKGGLKPHPTKKAGSCEMSRPFLCAIF
ncbi:hypothetical protein BPUTEOMOX_973 [methanotrophic endosymbiont of Bathymodiolus puteoserpentis (Logatchev)]|nr:hypothetical protein BPUTEOMOX_973 [methanotrophic endosymbiont of Bathymodiolus puteoserpentis (Logatchev)]